MAGPSKAGMLCVLAGLALFPAAASAAFPGQNGKIVFSSARDGTEEVYVADADGTNQTRLTDSRGGFAGFPDFSADGTMFAYTGGASQIYVMNADGTDQRRVTSMSGFAWMPSFSPDGSKIVFSGTDGVNLDIYVVGTDGLNLTRLTTDPGNDVAPEFSPDGSKIVFQADNGIHVINADGTNDANLTPERGFSRPDFSPDGSQIVFSALPPGVSDGSGPHDLYTVDADGGNLTRRTTPTVHEESPAFSPDGSKIIFASIDLAPENEDQSCCDISVLDISSGDATKVVDRLDSDFSFNNFPDWAPARVVHEGDLVVTDCDDPLLTEVTEITGDLIIEDLGCDAAIALPNLTRVGGDVRIVRVDLGEDAEVGVVDLGVLESVGGSVNISENTEVGVLDLAALASVGQDLEVRSNDIEMNTAEGGGTGFDLGGVTTVGGDVIAVGNVFAIDSGGVVTVEAPLIDVGGVTTVGGDVIAVGNVFAIDSGGVVTVEAPLIDVGGVTTVEGDVIAVDNVFAIDSGGVVTIDVQVINFADLESVGGDLTVTSNADAQLTDFGTLQSVGGDLTVTGNDEAEVIDLGTLESVGGDLTVTGNDEAEVTDLGTLESVGGDLTVTSNGDADVSDLGDLQSVGGDLTVETTGNESFSATTAGGTTDVTILGGTARMHVVLREGTFDRPVRFKIERQGDESAREGTTHEGAPAEIDPVGGYRFSFEVPELNRDATLGFTIDLSQLDVATRQAVLNGAQDGGATLVVKGDAEGASYQAFRRCGEGETPVEHDCVRLVMLHADGTPVSDPAQAAFVRFDGVTGRFSTWAVAIVTPRDITPPVVTCAEPAPVFLLAQHPAEVIATVHDDNSGPVAESVKASADTSRVGETHVSLTGRDLAGNETRITCSYRVEYRFEGFSDPVENLPATNSVRALRTVPLKWRLTDAAGTPVTDLATADLTAVTLACDLGTTADRPAEQTAGASGLKSLGDGVFQLNWQTPGSYAGSCKTLRLDLGEGAYRTAVFRFRPDGVDLGVEGRRGHGGGPGRPVPRARTY